MNLALTDDQRMIGAMAREFLEKECPPSLVREMERDETGYPTALWKQMADLGWMGLALPEEHGGAGMGLQDLAVLVEEFGRHLVPGPFIETVALCGLAIAEFGTDEQKSCWLPGIADGTTVLTYARTEPNGRWDADGIETTAKIEGDSLSLNGIKILVPYANTANSLLVAARVNGDDVEGGRLVLVDLASAGVELEQTPSLAGDPLFKVRLDSVQAPATNILGGRSGSGDAISRVDLLGAAVVSALMVGGAQRVLEMTLQFAQERKAFDKPIGAFQAIQHHCANMVTEVDGARLITAEAIWKTDNSKDARLDVSVAKAWVSDAYRRVLFSAHQVHGAIGYTKEHDLQLFTRRAKAAELAFGDSDYHRELVAQELGI